MAVCAALYSYIVDNQLNAVFSIRSCYFRVIFFPLLFLSLHYSLGFCLVVVDIFMATVFSMTIIWYFIYFCSWCDCHILFHRENRNIYALMLRENNIFLTLNTWGLCFWFFCSFFFSNVYQTLLCLAASLVTSTDVFNETCGQVANQQTEIQVNESNYQKHKSEWMNEWQNQQQQRVLFLFFFIIITILIISLLFVIILVLCKWKALRGK